MLLFGTSLHVLQVFHMDLFSFDAVETVSKAENNKNQIADYQSRRETDQIGVCKISGHNERKRVKHIKHGVGNVESGFFPFFREHFR